MNPGAATDDGSAPRRAFLARVRAALNRAGPRAPVPPLPPQLDDALVRRVHAQADLIGLFERRAAEIGLSVHRTTAARLADDVAGLLAARGVRRAALEAQGLPRHAEIDQRLRARGIEVLDPRAKRGADLFDVDAGVTGVLAALAESATLVCVSGDGRPRGLSLIPPMHVAIVRRREIVADLLDLWSLLAPDAPGDAPAESQPAPAALPSCIVLISGPSKTADIEGVLVTGVHGPAEVHAVVIEDD